MVTNFAELNSLFDVTKKEGINSHKESTMNEFESIIKSYERSLEFFKDIVQFNAHKIFFQDESKLVVKGQLAMYRINLESWFNCLRNPFGRQEFEPVEVHPCHQFVEKPERACVQIYGHNTQQPGLDFICSYIMGLINDKAFFLQEHLHPLRIALIRTYGYVKSPLSDTLQEYFESFCQAKIDYEQQLIKIKGTNGWVFQINYQNPLMDGFVIEYHKPRQHHWKKWNQLSRNAKEEFQDADEFDEIFKAVEFLSSCPRELRLHPTWFDKRFVFRLAVDYPPLAKSICEHAVLHPWFLEEKTDRWGEELNGETIDELDELIRIIKQKGGVI